MRACEQPAQEQAGHHLEAEAVGELVADVLGRLRPDRLLGEEREVGQDEVAEADEERGDPAQAGEPVAEELTDPPEDAGDERLARRLDGRAGDDKQGGKEGGQEHGRYADGEQGREVPGIGDGRDRQGADLPVEYQLRAEGGEERQGRPGAEGQG